MGEVLRRFATDAFPGDMRVAAWEEALSRLMLKSDPRARPAVALNGYASLGMSALGSAFAKLSASPQILSPGPSDPRAAHRHVMVFLFVDGTGCIRVGADSFPIGTGDIVVLDPARSWHIELHTQFQLIFAELGEVGFLLRLLRARTGDLNRISASSGLGAPIHALLDSIGECIDSLSPGDLGQVEAALTGMLVASLAHGEDKGGSEAADAPSAVQRGHLTRVCRAIEMSLADPQLSINEISALENLSPRYVQKLFHAAGTTFSEYLKKRRLDRCRKDLADPAFKHLTILELCFRWGFSDAANFSRAFRSEFHMTPKAYRASIPGVPKIRLRGRPETEQGIGRRHREAGPPLVGAEMPEPAADIFPREDGSAIVIADTRPDEPAVAMRQRHFHIPVSAQTVHWGYFSKFIKPIKSVRSGDVLTMEALTQHAYDDFELMIRGDPGAESVFHWDAKKKNVDRRGAGPMAASIYGRGAGEGFGVHICTGPVFVEEAAPGDVLEVRILDIQLRPSSNVNHRGRAFGSNAASWWGFHYHDLLTEPKPREVVTIYEIYETGQERFAKAVYNYHWMPQIDPFGTRHDTIDYPGIPVDPDTITKRYGVLQSARIPVRPHFGVLAVAPDHDDYVDSVPPGNFGGNLDNWRAARGASVFLPVAVPGALFSVGDPHASQGDSELCGTAIECSLTGKFQLVLHKHSALQGHFLGELDHPFLETETEWIIQGLSHANHLVELGPHAQTEVYKKASLDLAMRDAFRKTRRYLMTAHHLSEDEAISLMSVAVDFGVTQVVNGNWGVHAVIRKSIFSDPG